MGHFWPFLDPSDEGDLIGGGLKIDLLRNSFAHFRSHPDFGSSSGCDLGPDLDHELMISYTWRIVPAVRHGPCIVGLQGVYALYTGSVHIVLTHRTGMVFARIWPDCGQIGSAVAIPRAIPIPSTISGSPLGHCVTTYSWRIVPAVRHGPHHGAYPGLLRRVRLHYGVYVLSVWWPFLDRFLPLAESGRFSGFLHIFVRARDRAPEGVSSGDGRFWHILWWFSLMTLPLQGHLDWIPQCLACFRCP